MMSLYVSSHYKNSPDDLQLMSDAPAHRMFVLLGPIQETSVLPDILCVIQVRIILIKRLFRLIFCTRVLNRLPLKAKYRVNLLNEVWDAVYAHLVILFPGQSVSNFRTSSLDLYLVFELFESQLILMFKRFDVAQMASFNH